MNDSQIARDAAAAVEAAGGSVAHLPGHQLAVPNQAELAELLGARVIPVRQWAGALVEAERFEEDNEEDAALSIVRAILLAETPEAVFAAMNVQSVDELLGKEPGARSSVFEIHSATPLASTFSEGPSCFAVIQAINLAEKEHITLSCGGRAVQAAILAHVIRGWLPMRAVFTRRRKPTRSGFYPINLERGI